VATERDGEVVVWAGVAVNAFGDLARPADAREPLPPPVVPVALGENTTIGVVVTNARLDKAGCLLVAQGGHDGYARALEPVHTAVDGDAVVACATGAIDGVSADRVRLLAARAVEAAIRGALDSTR
jgi:L-aminopeptidase/D-esterase-like protein